MKSDDPLDRKGLIREAYRIEGITDAECRSIFLDWALSLPDGQDNTEAITQMLAQYGDGVDHPMTEVLREGLMKLSAPRRRGGWRSRPRN
ncbi:MAG: hypothetical protein AB3N23_20220 [Paracoccaceae bacterium]